MFWVTQKICLGVLRCWNGAGGGRARREMVEAGVARTGGEADGKRRL